MHSFRVHAFREKQSQLKIALSLTDKNITILLFCIVLCIMHLEERTSCRRRFNDSTSCECFASASIELSVLSTMSGLVGPSQTLEFADAGCVESSE